MRNELRSPPNPTPPARLLLLCVLAAGCAVAGCAAGRARLASFGTTTPTASPLLVYELHESAVGCLQAAVRPTGDAVAITGISDEQESPDHVQLAGGEFGAGALASDVVPAAAAVAVATPPYVYRNARLTIEPSGERDRNCLVVLELESAATERTSSANGHPSRPGRERYVLAISTAEVQLIFADLDAAGVFGRQRRPEGGTHLVISQGREQIEKDWTPEPRLDELAERVLRDGQRDLGRHAL